jgi:hypothetical protein
VNDITKTGEPVVATPGVEAAKPYEGWSGDEILQAARERELVPDLGAQDHSCGLLATIPSFATSILTAARCSDYAG